MSKETWLTVKALCDKYGYSTSAYDKRRRKCLSSSF